MPLIHLEYAKTPKKYTHFNAQRDGFVTDGIRSLKNYRCKRAPMLFHKLAHPAIAPFFFLWIKQVQFWKRQLFYFITIVFFYKYLYINYNFYFLHL